MSDKISLSPSQTINLSILREIMALTDRTMQRLTTGKKVNSVIDNPVNFFISKSLYDRASDFENLKDNIDQGISTLTASLEASDAISEIIKQMKGLAEAAKSQSIVERKSSTQQFNELGTQISRLIEDASYNGYNLLTSTTNKLEVKFSERQDSKLVVGGFDFNSDKNAGLGQENNQLFSNAAYDSVENGGKFKGMSVIMNDAGKGFSDLGMNNSAIALVDTLISQLNKSLNRLNAGVNQLGSNVALLKTRLEFTDNYAQSLKIGGDKLTLADMNEEGANYTALNTRYQLGIQAMAIAGNRAKSILTLLQS